jgi:hypothetical protein
MQTGPQKRTVDDYSNFSNPPTVSWQVKRVHSWAVKWIEDESIEGYFEVLLVQAKLTGYNKRLAPYPTAGFVPPIKSKIGGAPATFTAKDQPILLAFKPSALTKLPGYEAAEEAHAKKMVEGEADSRQTKDDILPPSFKISMMYDVFCVLSLHMLGVPEKDVVDLLRSLEINSKEMMPRTNREHRSLLAFNEEIRGKFNSLNRGSM